MQCCSNGVVKLPKIKTDERIFRLLMTSCEFRTNVRKYNSAFAFSSSGVKYDKKLANGRQGVYTFRVSGGFNHFISENLIPKEAPCFAQLYIYDEEAQRSSRIGMMNGLDPDFYDVINQVIQQKNPFAKHMPRISSIINEDTQTYKHAIEPVQRRGRQSELPASTEISGLIPNNSG